MLPHDEGRTTRQQLLQTLRTGGGSSIASLSQALSITEMGVRRHVQALEREGLVEAETVKQAMGRPVSIYRLTPRADDLFPKNYPQLALDLLGELDDEPAGEAIIGRMFEGRRDKLIARHKSAMAGATLEERVAELAAIQQAGGYMSHWERDGAGERFTLYEYNCPIAQVAGKYREACRCEQQLFEALLGAEVKRTECIADGGAKCAYAIRRPAKERAATS
ncbi:Predicted transcriptional regulator, ArsR family [Cohnella sp. OV330]|uniref:helix-turn-helix transcriptional regulator n=1 Tax=Cohnella sp. OV330 TaxID=1855288 RepID=UPI0008E11EA4|nr:winged helix-turn-helix transcriptional regulator [Cohnella sp. OV330]SFB33462.1 Predicted transcriptional regulator, ArsR family [Cohnella sp. OV330]